MILGHSLYSDLIGKPFNRGGRGPEEYDCLGLCMEIFRRRGLVVPDYVSNADELHRQLAGDGAALAGMIRVQQPRGGEIALFRPIEPDDPCHMGVMLNPWHMIHIVRETRCAVERIASPIWKRRLIGYFQPAEAAC